MTCGTRGELPSEFESTGTGKSIVTTVDSGIELRLTEAQACRQLDREKNHRSARGAEHGIRPK